jgi:hypothetical protein
MEVTPEMVDAYIDGKLPWMDSTDRLRMIQGIAIYTHLQSSGSNEWRQQHGFKTTEQ